MRVDWKKFDEVLLHTRGYFFSQYHAGTREMIYRYVVSKMGDIDPVLISAALRILRDRGAVIYERKVWWFLADR